MLLILNWKYEDGDCMVDLLILKGLSFTGGVQFLKEEGYIEGEFFQKESRECDIILFYPYTLYDEKMCTIDQICHAEYCLYDEDNELNDIKSEWVRV